MGGGAGTGKTGKREREGRESGRPTASGSVGRDAVASSVAGAGTEGCAGGGIEVAAFAGGSGVDLDFCCGLPWG